MLLSIRSALSDEIFLDLTISEAIELGVLIVIYWMVIRMISNRVAQRLILISGITLGLSWALPYLGFHNLGLYALVMSVAIIVTVSIVFFDDLRKWVLNLSTEKIMKSPNQLRGFSGKMPDHAVRGLTTAIDRMKQEKMGALIVIPGNDDASIYMQDEVDINAIVSEELILSIFNPKSPLHDGAVVIEKDRIISARNILPVTSDASKTNFGTRHRAALGLSEKCDALVIVVSEERGTVSVCHRAAIRTLDDAQWKEELRGWVV